ncbi:MAG: outer membrane protein assembly factor, partial [Pseudaminobacter sp.]|nr:outer membrane protein assembly factor [Pseudaminobacter sp.]
MALALSLAGPAAAFELFGIKIFEGDKTDAEDVIGEPQPYSVDFTVSGTEDDIEETLKGASTLWKDREEPASGAAGLLAKARGDYRRILAALYGEGRYGGSISILVDGREAADLLPDTELPDPATVQIAIDPGPLFAFGKTEIVNPAPLPVDPGDEVEAPADEGFAPGEIARSAVVLKAERLSVEAWRQQGRAKAEIVERRVVAAHDRDILDATLIVEPGRKAAYGPVSVRGTDRMDPDFVAYMVDLGHGEEYDPDDIERASKRLGRLDVFRAQRIEEAEAIGPDGLLPISVVVQERLPRRFGVGASYSTIDGAGFEAYWMHRNLFGKAERLRLEAKVAGIGNDAGNGDAFDPADFTYRVGATFTRPGIYTPDTDFVASLIGEREVLDVYTKTGVLAQAGFTHLFSEQLSARLFASADHAEFDDDFGERTFTSAGFLGGLVFDNRDDPANATEGYFLEGVVEPFYEFEYGNAAFKVTGEGRAYYGFGEDDRIVAAGRLKLGSIVGPPVDEIAPDKLFFAGGGGSVRGYAYRSIGIVSPEGHVAGGRSLIEGSGELRARVTETIGLVAFADAGYVGAESFPDFDEDLRIGAGFGLRYLTGLGPIR